MKKILAFMCICFMMFQTLGMIPCKAVEIDGVTYTETKKEGTWFVYDDLVYHVIAKNKAEVCARTNKKVKNLLKIPEKVTYKGKKYTVTKIADMESYDIGGYDGLEGNELIYDISYIKYEYPYKSNLPKGAKPLAAKKLVLPKTLTYIGEGAFACAGDFLKEVKFASKYKKLVIGKSAFLNCNLKRMDFPKGTSTIEDYAVDADSITIPASVKKIGVGIVNANTQKVKIDKKNKKFKMKSGMLYTYNEKELLGISAKAKKNIKLSSKTTKIAEGAFEFCKATKIDLGGNVKEISARAFAKCHSLKEVTGTENVKKISFGAFYGCGELKEIENLSNVKEIENTAFWYTKNLSLSISSAMQIADYAFCGYECGTGPNVIVPENDSVYTIENGLLIKSQGQQKKIILQTKSMEMIVVPEGVTDVMTALGADGYCAEIVLPATQKAQHGWLYANDKITFKAIEVPVFGENFWINKISGKLTAVVVPKGCLKIYKDAMETASAATSTVLGSLFNEFLKIQESES